MIRERRDERQLAAEPYRPEEVRLLVVAEAPPASSDRYFYFQDVQTQDSLFRYVARLVLHRQETRFNKSALLAELKAAGVFLMDLCIDPIRDKRELRNCVIDAVERVTLFKPDHVILIKTTVYDAAFTAMKDAGLPVVDVRIPFPGSGQQLRFEAAMLEALDSIGWSERRG